MTTEIITLGEYRKNISSLWKKAKEKNIKYLVMVHGKPAFEVNPLFDNIIKEEIIMSPSEEKAYFEAMKDIENWDMIEINFDKIKTPEDFIKFIKDNELWNTK